ncbi:hypothetical protein H4R20_001390 [Coemansia guatemalensis]|uniref:DMAP1-binding domain-containing protein n=1 Tax=Coemansia guatemalensis TaxID=2761395 RepID=A0A9W8I207_9FUNG|nr:hypothetical protein H4R20_001390 [Coemansia guatemalensis]
MASQMASPAFDELPIVYQARIRDIEQELEEGEITQKGFDKRLAKIMQEYQTSLTTKDDLHTLGTIRRARASPTITDTNSVAASAADSPSGARAGDKMSAKSPTQGAAPAPSARSRNGSKKSFYDARKSTAMGFKKPGINFEALLDELGADDDDEDSGLQLPSNPSGPKALSVSAASSNNSGSRASSRLSSHFPFSLGSPLQPTPPVPALPRGPQMAYRDDGGDVRFDVELSSGRAYNVLHDIMDPYGAPSSRGDQQLYSDDSSGNSIIEELGDLGPNEFNPDVVTQSAVQLPHDPIDERRAYGDAAASPVTKSSSPVPDDDAASVSSSIEIKRMNSLMYPHRKQDPGYASLAKAGDLRRQVSRQNSKHGPPPLPSTTSANIQSDLKTLPAPKAADHTLEDISQEREPGDALHQNGSEVTMAHSISAPVVDTHSDSRALEARSTSTPAMNGDIPLTHRSPPDISLLTPDTPGAGLFVFNNLNDVMTDTQASSAQPTKAQLVEDGQAGLTPESGTPGMNGSDGEHRQRSHTNDSQRRFSSFGPADTSDIARRARNGTITLEDMAAAADNSAMMLDILAARGNRSSLLVPGDRQRSSQTDSSHRGSYSHWVEYTVGAEEQGETNPGTQLRTDLVPESPVVKEPLHDARLAAQLEQSLSFSESLTGRIEPQKIAPDSEGPEMAPAGNFGQTDHHLSTSAFANPEGMVPVISSRAIDSDTDDGREPAMASTHRAQLIQEQQYQQMASDSRLKRRPTYGTRLDRRPTNAMGTNGVGRASYYVDQADLEIPANFDMPAWQGAEANNQELGISDMAVVRGGISAQRTPDQSGAQVLGQTHISATAPVGGSSPAEVASSIAPNTAPLPDMDMDMYTMAFDQGSHELQQQQQQQQPMDVPGAIIRPRDMPSEAYSSKLKDVMAAHGNLPSVLRHRASATPNEIAYTCVDGKGREVGSWTWAGLHIRAIQIAQLLRQKGVTTWGERVALVYRKYEVLDFVGSLFGCFYAGLCAVPIVAGDSYAELVHVLNSTGAVLVLTTELNIKALNKDLTQSDVGAGWPTGVDWLRTDNLGGNVLSAVGALSPSGQYHARPAPELTYNSQLEIVIDSIKPEDLAYIEFSKSPNGELKGVQITHGAVMRQCSTWMMCTGMLDVGRKYKHRVELDEDSASAEADYALGLADPNGELDADSDPSTPQSPLDTPALPQSLHNNSSSAVSTPPAEREKHAGRSSLGKKWSSSSGFLGRLRNVGSLPKLRRGSKSRESALSKEDGHVSHSSTRNSLMGVSFGGSGRLRATSNLSAVSHTQPALEHHAAQQGSGRISPAPKAAPREQQRTQAAAPGSSGFSTGTPSANVAVFKDVVAFYIEPRQHLGLVYGILGGTYGGHQSIYVSSALCDVPGAYINLLTRYRATVVLGDYTGLQSVLAAATDEPDEIFNYSKKVAPNLARLRLCLVDTLFIDSDFNAAFDKNVLHPFGCPYQGITATEGHPVVTPVCTLAEHGSALMAMRDCLPSFAPPGAEDSAQKCEFVLDRHAFKENRIVVLPDERNEAEVDRIGTVRYQSFGFPALDSTIAVVDPETRELCAADAIGELWISSPGLGSGFWGLPKLSSSIFAARFTYAGGDASEVSGDTYLRTGLMGAVVQGQVLVFGFYEDRIRTLTAEPGAEAAPGWVQEPALGFHYSGDINSTIRRYLPQVTECATFEMYSNDTHFPVVAAEVRHNSGMYSTIAEEVYGVLRNYHGLFAYAIALCPPESLPRAFQYGKRTVNAQLCRHLFESGKVNCLYVKITTDQLFLNLPPPASTLVDDICDQDASVAQYGRWQQQTSLEAGMPSVDEATGMDLASFQSITEVLAWRAGQTPEHVAYAQFDERGRPLKPMTFQKLASKVAGAAQLMLDRRRVGAGSHVIVAIAPSPSFVVAVHACLAIGAIPIAVAPPDTERLAEDMPPLLVTAREYGAGIVLVDAQSEEVFKSKMMDVAMRVPALRALLGARRMPAILSLARASKPKHPLGRGNLRFDAQWAAPGRAALVMLFTGAQPSTPQYVSYSHRALLRFCAQQKGDFQMPASLPLIASVRAYNGYGLLHCAVLGVYVGCTTLLLAPSHYFAAPNVWFELVQRHRVKDAFATLPMLQHAMNFFSAYIGQHSFNLSAVRNLIIATDERVDPHTYAAIRDFFARHRLDEMAINPLYGTPMNPCISTRAYLGVGPLALHLDAHALRRCRAVAVPPPEVAADDMLLHTLLLQDSGKVSGSTMVAIVDPSTHRPLPAGSIGEVWVCSASNASRKHAPLPSIPAAVRPPPAVDETSALLDGNPTDEFVRTGDLGFLYLQVAPEGAPAEPYLFVAGKVAESFSVDGYMYFYSDIERAVAELADDVGMATCVVIQTTLPASPATPDTVVHTPASSALRLVAVISLRGPPSDSFLPNAACLIFNNVLDRHQVLLDEIVFVPRDALPRSRIPERRRRTVRGMYESAKLKAYVNFPISSSSTLPSGLANPNTRHSFLGPPGLATASPFLT